MEGQQREGDAAMDNDESEAVSERGTEKKLRRYASDPKPTPPHTPPHAHFHTHAATHPYRTAATNKIQLWSSNYHLPEAGGSR